MKPDQLIGMGYRLGATPLQHGKGDCFSVAATVVRYFGFDSPKPQRDWYRRLRRGDYSVFREELQRWGQITDRPRLGTVALCEADNGYGLAAYYSDGWLSYRGSEVVWSPIDVLGAVEFYFPRKPNSAMRLV